MPDEEKTAEDGTEPAPADPDTEEEKEDGSE